jgi:hypothetical protein
MSSTEEQQKPAEEKPVEETKADETPAEDNKPADDKPADDKPAEEGKPAEENKAKPAAEKKKAAPAEKKDAAAKPQPAKKAGPPPNENTRRSTSKAALAASDPAVAKFAEMSARERVIAAYNMTKASPKWTKANASFSSHTGRQPFTAAPPGPTTVPAKVAARDKLREAHRQKMVEKVHYDPALAPVATTFGGGPAKGGRRSASFSSGTERNPYVAASAGPSKAPEKLVKRRQSEEDFRQTWVNKVGGEDRAVRSTLNVTSADDKAKVRSASFSSRTTRNPFIDGVAPGTASTFVAKRDTAVEARRRDLIGKLKYDPAARDVPSSFAHFAKEKATNASAWTRSKVARNVAKPWSNYVILEKHAQPTPGPGAYTSALHFVGA